MEWLLTQCCQGPRVEHEQLVGEATVFEAPEPSEELTSLKLPPSVEILEDASGTSTEAPDEPDVDEITPISAACKVEAPTFGDVSEEDPVQLRAIEELRRRLSDVLDSPGPLGLSATETVKSFGGVTSCFNRFLQAERWKVEKAEAKLRNTFAWRKTVNANSALECSNSQKVWAMMQPHWPEKVIGATPSGNPVTYFDIGQAVKCCQMDFWTPENVQNFYVTWMEHSLRLQREGRDRHGPQGPCNNMPASVVVYNLKSLRLADCLKCVSGLQSFAKILAIIEEHYPVNLHQAVITNVPYLFYRVVWPVVQKALDHQTVSRIMLTDGEGRDLISKVLCVSDEKAQALLRSVFFDGATKQAELS